MITQKEKEMLLREIQAGLIIDMVYDNDQINAVIHQD